MQHVLEIFKNRLKVFKFKMTAVIQPSRAFLDSAYKIDKAKVQGLDNETYVEENRENERIFNMAQSIKKSGDANKQLEKEKPIVISEKTCDKQNNLGKSLQDYDATKNLDVENNLDITTKMRGLKLDKHNTEEERNLEAVVKDMNGLNISNPKEDTDKSKDKKVKRDKKEKRGNKENKDAKSGVDDNNKKKGKSKEKKVELSPEDEEKLKRRRERKELKEKERKEQELRAARILENDKHMVSRGPTKKVETPTKSSLSHTSGGRIIRTHPEDDFFNLSDAMLDVIAQNIMLDSWNEFLDFIMTRSELEVAVPQSVMDTLPQQGYINVEPVTNTPPLSPEGYINAYHTIPINQPSPSTAASRRYSDADSGLGHSPLSIRSTSPDGVYRNLSSPTNNLVPPSGAPYYQTFSEEVDGEEMVYAIPIPTTVAALGETPAVSAQDRMKGKLDKQVKAFISAELLFRDKELRGVDSDGNTLLMHLFQLNKLFPNFLELCYCLGERQLTLDKRAERNEDRRLPQVNQRGQNLLGVIRANRIIPHRDIILEYFTDLCQNRLYN